MKSRIVTVCVKGKPPSDDKDNKEREKILEDVVEDVKIKWKKIDVIVFPGGFFYLGNYIGHLSFEKRVKVLSKTSFHKICKKMCRKLPKNSLIIAGVDSENPKEPKIKGEWGDQLCVAFSRHGIEGIGRKIFPVKNVEDVKGCENNYYVCYSDDFFTDKRIVKLRNGEKIILCACYDMFGVAMPNKKEKNILFIDDKRYRREDGSEFKNIRKSCIEKFNKMIKRKKIASGIVAIHRFTSHGNSSGKVMWQRHGIASCSAALGKFAVGAAHFEELPRYDISTLVSNKVPKNHLSKSGHNRKSHEVLPKDNFILNKVLVRLFEL